ncbi:MAG: hypothetical protein COB46_10790 [Rhodospirillaceae bacterium]|nr:MAG: hypothetical protein COB46_10790 [Rhodospirillaceae bacterium]
MKAHMEATTVVGAKTQGKLETGDIFDYHEKVFAVHDLPSTTFGGSPFTGTREEAELLDIFW